MKLKSAYLLFTFLGIFSFSQNYTYPSERAESVVSKITVPAFPDFLINLQKLGAKPNSNNDSKPFFDKAMALLKKKNGGTIIVPKGVYLLNGPIHFVSNVKMHLEEGTVLRFSDNPKYYPMVLTSWEGTMLYNYSPLIYANNCQNIAITGTGTIDGEGSKNWLSFKAKENNDKMLSREMNHTNVPLENRKFGKGHFLRPQLIQFLNSKNILVENVKIEDAPFWCLHLLKSENITIRGVRYESLNPNNDGIDPEYSKNILIENVTFNNGDDNVAIKAGRDHEGRANTNMPSENIVIRNCNFKGLHAVVLGSEMSAGVRNIFVENNKAVGYLKRGIYLKTNADRGGYIKDVFVNSLQLDEVEDCIYITSNYHGEGSGFPSDISEVYFTNISCNKANEHGIVIQGYPEKKVKNIYFNQINIKSAKNAISSTDVDHISINEISIGEKAFVPSAAK